MQQRIVRDEKKENITCNACILWEFCKARDPTDLDLNECTGFIHSKEVEEFLNYDIDGNDKEAYLAGDYSK